jgi:hypothetical protein
MKNPILSAWKSYEVMVLPKEASEVQKSETKQAFFAGAATIFQALMAGLSDGPEETEGDMTMLADIETELRAFGTAFDKKVLGIQTH